MILLDSVEKVNVFHADRLVGNSFQDFVAETLKKNGFTDVEVAGKRGDQGEDLLVTRDNKKL